MKVLHHSIFEPLPNGHGGEKRSYQIYVEAQENGVAFANLVFTHKEYHYAEFVLRLYYYCVCMVFTCGNLFGHFCDR